MQCVPAPFYMLIMSGTCSNGDWIWPFTIATKGSIRTINAHECSKCEFCDDRQLIRSPLPTVQARSQRVTPHLPIVVQLPAACTLPCGTCPCSAGAESLRELHHALRRWLLQSHRLPPQHPEFHGVPLICCLLARFRCNLFLLPPTHFS